METRFLRQGCHILLLILTIYSCGIAQSNSVETNNNYDCRQQPIGWFRQITNASFELSNGFYGTFVFTKESDRKENRLTLDALDEVDPAYKFYLIRNSPKSAKEKCGATMEVVGKLISPTGKLFDFKQATYDIPSRKLKFMTIERDGIIYEVEVQFFDRSKFVSGMFQEGTAKLKATGKTLGTVLIEFPFTSWSFE